MEIREKLKTAMQAKGYNLTTLSEKSGVSTGVISRYLKGTMEPKSNNISKLSKALGVSPIYFLDLSKEDDKMLDLVINKIKILPTHQLEQVNKFIDTFLINNDINEQ